MRVSSHALFVSKSDINLIQPKDGAMSQSHCTNVTFFHVQLHLCFFFTCFMNLSLPFIMSNRKQPPPNSSVPSQQASVAPCSSTESDAKKKLPASLRKLQSSIGWDLDVLSSKNGAKRGSHAAVVESPLDVRMINT